MDPVLNQMAGTISNSISGGVSEPNVVSKEGASQFDRVRAQLQQTAESLRISPQQPPSEVQSPGATPSIAGAGTERAGIEKNLAVGRYHIERIHAQIRADPSKGTLQKTITGKLTSIEHQYNQLDVALRQVSPDASPQQWLRLQQMANTMNENISVLSKLVDSAASGVKTILQTQI